MANVKRVAALAVAVVAVVVVLELAMYRGHQVERTPSVSSGLSRRLNNSTDLIGQGTQQAARSSSVDLPTGTPTPSPFIMNVSSGAMDKRYMLSLHYAEQLSNAGQHYVSFLNMAALYFNMTGVRPFVSGSRIFGLRSIHPTTYFGMERLLDLSSVDQTLSACLYHRGEEDESHSRHVFNTMEEFLLQSHREIILVYPVDHFGALNYLSGALSLDSFKDLDRNLNLGPSIATECTSEMNQTRAGSNPLRSIESLLNSDLDYYSKFKLPRFRIIKSYCVNRGIDSTVEKLRDIVLGNGSTLDASVLFVTWQGGFTGNTFTHGLTECRVNLIPMSAEVLNTTHVFSKSLQVVKPFISVHLRLEWIFRREKKNFVYMVCCLNHLAELVDVVAEKYDLKKSRILLIKDFGAYGSDACNVKGTWSSYEVCINRTDKALVILKQILSFPFTEVEFNATNFKDAPQNTGFSSLVESQLLTEGAVLITLGGGNFQKSLRERFIQNQVDYNAGKDRHFGVCTDILPGVTLQSQSCD